MFKPLFHCAALALVLTPAGTAFAQTVKLDCEVAWTSRNSIGGREPIQSRWIDFIQMTIDLAGKSARIDYQMADGVSGTVIRPLLIATPQEVVLCQGEKCQDPIYSQGGQGSFTRLGLTTIDLRTGVLKRNRYDLFTKFVNGLSYDKDASAIGTCRRMP